MNRVVDIKTEDIAIKLIIALFKEQIINEATYNKIMQKYRLKTV